MKDQGDQGYKVQEHDGYHYGQDDVHWILSELCQLQILSVVIVSSRKRGICKIMLKSMVIPKQSKPMVFGTLLKSFGNLN